MAEIVAQSQAGAVRGITLESGIHRFLGVPYGASTGGIRRFRPPLPAEPWEGVRDALEFGHRSPQDMTRVRDEDPSAFTGPDTPSEDCLVANVWTPSVGDGARRPVMCGCMAVGSAAAPPPASGATARTSRSGATW